MDDAIVRSYENDNHKRHTEMICPAEKRATIVWFKQGFFAECYRRSPDPKVRSKYPQERQIWLEALDRAVKQGDREADDYGFYPSSMELACLPIEIWDRKFPLIDLEA